MEKKLYVFLIALIVGLMHILPHVLLKLQTDSSRVYYPFSFAETLYAAQVKEAVEGHLTVGDPQFWEHKYTFPSVFPIIPVWVLTLVSVIFGSVARGFLVGDFLFPACLFLVLTGFTYSILKNKWPAIFISLSTLTLYQLATKFPPLSSDGWLKFIRQLILLDVTQPLPFYRTPNPQISFIFLVSALWGLWFLWVKFNWKKWAAVLLLGVSLYTVYFYHLTYFLGVVGVLVGISLLNKRFSAAIPLISLLGILVACGWGYLLLTEQAQYAALAITGGKFAARYIDYLYSLRYGIIIFLLTLFRHRLGKTLFLFLVSMVGSGIIVMNFQLFTGWTMQPGHWPQTTIEPFMVIISGIVLFRFVFLKRMHEHLARWGTLLLLIYGMAVQVRFAETHQGEWSIPRDLNTVLSWIDKNTPSQSVIVSLDVETLAYVPVLTSGNIYLPVEEYHYATIEEIWERILYAQKLYEIPPEKFSPKTLPLVTHFELTYNTNKFKHDSLDRYSPETQKLINSCYPSLCSALYALPIDMEVDVKKKYSRVAGEENPYRLDYAIYSDREERLGAISPAGNLVFNSGMYQVYQLSSPKPDSP